MGQFGDDMIQLYKQFRSQKKNLKNMTHNLRQDRNQQQKSVMNDLQKLHKARIERSKSLSKNLKQSRRSIGKSVANIKNESAKAQDNFRQEFSSRSQQERSNRKAYLSGIQLYMMLDTEQITQEEFDAQEEKLLDRLEVLENEFSDDDE